MSTFFKHRHFKWVILLGVLLLVVGGVLFFLLPCNTSYPIEKSAEYKQAHPYKQDVLYYCALLEDTHPDTVFFETQKWQAEKQKAIQAADSCKSNEELALIVQQLSALLNDSHTFFCLNLLPIEEHNSFYTGLTFRWVADKLYIVEVHESNKHLLGKEVEAINHIPVSVLLQRTAELIGSENELKNKKNLITLLQLNNRHIIEKLGVADKASRIKSVVVEGNEIQVNNSTGDWVKIYFDSHPITRQMKNPIDFYVKNEVGYLQVNSMTSNLGYAENMFTVFFNKVASLEIKNIIIDFRYNGGGNSIIGEMLLEHIKHAEIEKTFSGRERASHLQQQMRPAQFVEEQTTYNHYTGAKFEGNVYFIQGANSFSSAVIMLTLIADNNLFPTIGEPASQKPCRYGDILFFSLPNSKLQGGVSYKYFIRPDTTKCADDCLYPTVNIPYTLEDYINGVDPWWSWIMNDIDSKTKLRLKLGLPL